MRWSGSIDGIEAEQRLGVGMARPGEDRVPKAPTSATLPRYITITRSDMKRTTLRSCEMKM